MVYKDLNDYELLYMVAENTDDSVTLILEKYQPVIQRKIEKWSAIARKLSLDFDDLKQEVYYSVVLATRNYDEEAGASFYTYLSMVIDQRLKNVMRDHEAKKHQFLNQAVSLFSSVCNDELLLEDVLGCSPDVIESQIIEQDLYHKIEQFSYTLSLENAQILELYLNGYEVVSIASLLSIPSARISSTLYRLRKKLKKYLLEQELFVV